MFVVGKQYVSDDIAERQFVCNLERCKGACCVDGDSGAPLTFEETELLEELYPKIKPYLTEEGIAEIEEDGEWGIDDDDEYVTPLVKGAQCAYVTFDNSGTALCGIEKAFLDGKINFRKPISCHLYPIRITQYEEFDALNYSEWDICNAACVLGESLGVEVYKFLKEPLIRKYGEDWYKELVAQIEERKKEAELK